MPKYEVTDSHLLVHLSLIDRIKTLRSSFAVPKENIRGATEDTGVIPDELGLRAPGTAWPNAVYAGTFFKRFERQFVSWQRGESPVVVELKDHKFARLIIGSKEPRELARQINSLVA